MRMYRWKGFEQLRNTMRRRYRRKEGNVEMRKGDAGGRQRRDVGGGRGGGNKTLLTRGGSGQLIPEDVSLFSTIDTTNPEYTKGTLKDIIEGSLPNCVTVEVTPDLRNLKNTNFNITVSDLEGNTVTGQPRQWMENLIIMNYKNKLIQNETESLINLLETKGRKAQVIAMLEEEDGPMCFYKEIRMITGII